MPGRFQRAYDARPVHSSTSSYAAMDDDPGVLSRQRRLSVERRMNIQVTTEVEVKMEVLEQPATAEYNVGIGYRGPQQDSWDDALPILGQNRSEVC